MNKLLKEKEILSYLNISRTTLWRLKKQGLPAFKVGDSYRYNPETVTEWIVSEDKHTFKINTNNSDKIIPDNEKGERIVNNYRISLKYLFDTNLVYLRKQFSSSELEKFKKNLDRYKENNSDNQKIVRIFSDEYLNIVKKNYQISTRPKSYNKKLNQFIEREQGKIKIVWGDCLVALRSMETESIQLMVTSPPYYNAREYSQWDNIEKYLSEMREIIRESYRVLDNHRVWVFNVGDIFDNDKLTTKSIWGKKRIPLGAYFTKIFEEEGFEFVDDIIWDKGEVESKRHMNNGMNYPLYQYPLNCYEHILIFHKHRLDKTKIPCPVCGSLNVNGNTQSEIGVQSWECKNKKCFIRSPNNRGKRFSLRTNLMQYYHNNDSKNVIEKNILGKWRRDIVQFSPVIKINSNGENTFGHTAPFPKDIPEMAIKYFTFHGENVLDPFAGSFTTAIAANKLGRVGVGIEINKKLFRKAIIKNISNSLNLFGENIYEEYEL